MVKGRMAGGDIRNDRIGRKFLHQPAERFQSHGTEFIGISDQHLQAWQTALMMVARNASEMSESNSMEMLLYVSFAVERIARFELYDTRDIFSKI